MQAAAAGRYTCVLIALFILFQPVEPAPLADTSVDPTPFLSRAITATRVERALSVARSGAAAPAAPPAIGGPEDEQAASPADEPVKIVTVVVRQGQSLWSLAAEHGTTIEGILDANHLADGAVLRIGQSLVIPSGSAASPTDAAAAAPRKTAVKLRPGARIVTIRLYDGQTLWDVSQTYGATIDETKWNRLGDSKRRDGFWIKDDAFLNGQGQLVLRTRKDGERFTCGAVNTQGKFEHAFGYYVARCKLPAQPGHWPAFWLMSKGVNHVGEDGRDGTEIDIIEIPWRDGRLTSNLHWDGYGRAHQSAGAKYTIPAVTNGYHAFSLLWQPAQYVFYVDGKEVWRSVAGGVSQAAEYIKLTEEVGKWGGDIRAAQLPDAFEVDYVRVYDLVTQSR